MYSQRVNCYTNKTSKRHSLLSRRAQILSDRPIHDVKTGFIQHPTGYPIEVKYKRFWEKWTTNNQLTSRIGIKFDSVKHIKLGSFIDIFIPLPDKTEQFAGKVVLVRENSDCYEIGLCFLNQEDASRARIVEQICHIELYMQEKKYKEGPYNLSPERVAQEWITKYASDVPSL